MKIQRLKYEYAESWELGFVSNLHPIQSKIGKHRSLYEVMTNQLRIRSLKKKCRNYAAFFASALSLAVIFFMSSIRIESSIWKIPLFPLE